MDLMLVLPLVLLAVMMFFMWRSNKRNQEKQQQLRQTMAPGVEVMTQTGIYGTIVELDSENNVAVLESTPGTRIRVHSATIVQVVTPTVVVPDDASALADDPVDGTSPYADHDPVIDHDSVIDRDPAAPEAGDDPSIDFGERDERDGDQGAPKA